LFNFLGGRGLFWYPRLLSTPTPTTHDRQSYSFLDNNIKKCFSWHVMKVQLFYSVQVSKSLNVGFYFANKGLRGFHPWSQRYNIVYICYLLAGRSVLGKLCPRSWVRPEAAGRGLCSRPSAQFFPIRTDVGRQITCLFFISGKLLYKKYFVDFLLQRFHTVRVHLTFRSSKPVLFTGI